MRLSGLVLVLALGAAARAEQLTDAVPGHPGITYGDLMKQVIPDLEPQDGGRWSGTDIPALAGPDGNPDQNDLSGGFVFSSVDVLKVREAGKSRILLLTGGTETDSFAEILAAFDDEATVPKLLDLVDIGVDRFTNFGDAPQKLSEADDLFVLDNSHSNSNQEYLIADLMFLRDGRFRRAAEVMTLSERLCTHEMRETSKVATKARRGAVYRDVDVAVTQETTLTDLDCGDARRPKPGRKVWRDVFRWDPAKREFVSRTDRLGDLAKDNEKQF
ncbi:MAG: hypothetical protein JOZ72_11230 [Alphaproteobacteria bacterium]|nr:hypothetical protein [Alphaproteobacteria bacterium]